MIADNITTDSYGYGSYEWNIPPEFKDKEAFILIRENNNLDEWSISDKFEVLLGTIEIESPAGTNNMYKYGKNFEIKWSTKGLINYVGISVFDETEGQWHSLTVNTENDGSFIWENIPDPMQTYNIVSKYKIHISANNAPSEVFDEEEFFIEPPFINKDVKGF